MGTLAPRPSHFTTYRREKGSTAAAAAAMFHARLSLFVFLAVAATAAMAQSESCPFYPGICPVTLDNTIGCDYHDVNDIYSCQLNCKTITSCNYFSMFDDAERNQKKCFHFAQCGESCPECTTGPTTPDVGDCLPKKKTFPPVSRPQPRTSREGGYVCDMNRLNIVDVLFLDVLDEYSCGIECRNDDYCNFYTNYLPENGAQRKCFLFAGCDAPEDCPTCTTEPKPTRS